VGENIFNTSRSKIINAPARVIFRMLEIYKEHISFTVYYCGTDGNLMLNVVPRDKGKCLLLELNLYIHTCRKKIFQDLRNSSLQRTEIKLLSSSPNVVEFSL